MRKVTVLGVLTLCFMLTLAIGASHAATQWMLSGVYMESCNCDIPCPCATGGAPTHGNCQAFVNWHIAHGFYGDVALDGLNVTIMVDIPGLVGEGNWTIATYVPEEATPEQIEAIQSIIQESVGPLVSEDLGVKSVPLTFAMGGDTYKVNIPDILEVESTLLRDMPSVDGFFAPTYHQAEAVVQTYSDYGREWDFSGQNSWQGRLLLPQEEPEDAVVGSFRTGSFPEGLAVNPYTREAFVTNKNDGTAIIIDLNTYNVTKTIPIGGTVLGPDVNPDTNIAVVARRIPDETDTVVIIDLTTGEVKNEIPVGETTACLVIDSSRNTAIVPNVASGNVVVIDLDTEEIIHDISVGAKPTCTHWAVNPFTNQAVSALMGENALSLIDLEQGVVIDKIPVGEAPLGAALNPYTNVAIVANPGSHDVSVVDLTAREVIATIPIGATSFRSPICGIIDPFTNLAFTALLSEDAVAVIDLNTLSLVDTIRVGSQPSCFAIDEATGTVLVTNRGSNDVTIIDPKKIATATEDFSNTFFLTLESGLNMISMPLRPITPRAARDLMNEVGATVVIEYDTARGRFVGFTEADSGDGFAIRGGQGYIVNVTESKVIPFVGAAWTNEPPVAAAPPAELRSDAWAFVVSGKLDDHQVSDYTVTATNLRTGAVAVDSMATGRFDAVFADLSRNPVVEAGDRVQIVVRDGTGAIVAGPAIHQVGTVDIRRAFTDVLLRFGRVVPEKSALLQNYPNPFNPETWIPYQLRDQASVVIRIHNAAGQLVRTLDLGHRDAGVYTSRSRAEYWDGKNEAGEEIASGLYFYTITAGDFSAIRRMVVKK